MPEYLRSLIVIVFLAIMVFALAKAPVCAKAVTVGDFERRRNLWFAITLALFLAHNMWVFLAITATLLLFTLPKEHNRLALFFLLLFAAPGYRVVVPGFGVVNYLFVLEYRRLLTLIILAPVFLSLIHRRDIERFGRSVPDKLLAVYLILLAALAYDATHQLTEVLRSRVFYPFIDVFLPYYVASRAIRDLNGFRDALTGFVLAAVVLGSIGSFEFIKHWLLYHPLQAVLGAQDWGWGHYITRGSDILAIRALGSTGQPIVLGYVMTVALAFSLYLRESIPSRTAWVLGIAALCGGLIAALSRGPWVGAAAMLVVFIATGPRPTLGFAKLGLVGVVALPALLFSSAGSTIVSLLPFVGTVENHNIVYREQFTRISIRFILDHPFFGAYNFVNAPVMDVLKNSNGMLDTLNVFLTAGLTSGLIGMSLFTGIFVAVAVGIFKGMRNRLDTTDEVRVLGRAMLSAVAGIVIILCTASNVLAIPIVYWSVLGLGVAYARLAGFQPGRLGHASPGSSRIRI